MKKYLFAAIAAMLVFPIISNAQMTPSVVSFTATESSAFGGSTKIEWQTANTESVRLSYIGGLDIWNAETGKLLPTVQIFTENSGTLYIKVKNMVGRTVSTTFTLDPYSPAVDTYTIDAVRKTLTIERLADVTTPAVKSVFPSSGAAGTAITITGVNFETSAGNQWITFALSGTDVSGEKSYKIAAQNSTTIKATFPTSLDLVQEDINAPTTMPTVPGKYLIVIENNNGRGEAGYFTVTTGNTNAGSGISSSSGSSSSTGTSPGNLPSQVTAATIPSIPATMIQTPVEIKAPATTSTVTSATISNPTVNTAGATINTNAESAAPAPAQPEKRSAVATFFIKIFSWFKK